MNLLTDFLDVRGVSILLEILNKHKNTLLIIINHNKFDDVYKNVAEIMKNTQRLSFFLSFRL